MISEQVKELRNYEMFFNKDRIDGNLSIIFKRAADTIESLSAKLQATNMEELNKYRIEEKKLIEEMAEEIENCYGKETELAERAREFLQI